MKERHAEIICTSLEDVMHDSFMPYAEYVILERALPRVEDGLKPVQRRILFAMHEMQIFPDSKHKKCARVVGETMGKFHPHGDTSIYDALARMAQDFSMNVPLMDGQGNFGSIDGDGPAAMRYTEVRLAPLAIEILRDIDKETVPFALNFDDSLKEPMMLPSRYPNLLVNGSTGIAVGMATNIPPHNIGESIDAVIVRMRNPDCALSTILKVMKGPDFPTGGILLESSELENIYSSGRGKISLRARTEFEYDKNGKKRIVVTELPYEVRESAMLKKIQMLRETRKEMFASIDDVRSETDRTGLRAVIELKRGADEKKVLDCLFKYSDLQISYGINMVAIAEGQPKQLGLLPLIDYYVAYQRTVVLNRVKYDIERAQEREHKLAGLIIAVSNIDRVIELIKSSQNTREAKQRLMEEAFVCKDIAQLPKTSIIGEQMIEIDGGYKLTGVQAQAILDLRLSRLTHLEILTLKKEYEEIVALLNYLIAIFESPEKLDDLIVDELKHIKSKHNVKRRTELRGESAAIEIIEEDFKAAEPCAVVLTKSGNLKRVPHKIFMRAEGDVEEKNLPAKVLEATTADRIRMFTDFGNLLTLSVSSVKECKYRDPGIPLSAIVAGMAQDEKIIGMYLPTQGELLTVSSQGFVKRTLMEEFDTKKTKIAACGIKEGDKLVLAMPYKPGELLLMITKKGMSLCLNPEEINPQGRTAKGVGGIRLAPGDRVIYATQFEGDGNVVVFSDNGYAKQSAIVEYELQGRNGKGLKTLNWLKNSVNGSTLVAAFYTKSECSFELTTNCGCTFEAKNIPNEPRYSKGEQVANISQGDYISLVTLKKEEQSDM